MTFGESKCLSLVSLILDLQARSRFVGAFGIPVNIYAWCIGNEIYGCTCSTGCMLRMTSATSFTTTLRQRERDSVCVRERDGD
jgi:hypothetical protein